MGSRQRAGTEVTVGQVAVTVNREVGNNIQPGVAWRRRPSPSGHLLIQVSGPYNGCKIIFCFRIGVAVAVGQDKSYFHVRSRNIFKTRTSAASAIFAKTKASQDIRKIYAALHTLARYQVRTDNCSREQCAARNRSG